MRELYTLFNQTIIYGLSSVVARVVNFFLVPLYTVLLIPSEYAVVTEMYAYAAFLIVFGSFGMETTFFRFTSLEKKNKNLVFSTSFHFLSFNALLFLLAITVFYKELATLISHENNPEYLLFFAVIIMFDIMSIIPFAVLRHHNKALKFAAIKTTNIVCNIFFNIFFLIICPYLIQQNLSLGIIEYIYNPNLSVSYIFISNLIASIITIMLLMPEIVCHLGRPEYELFKKMINYAWPILIAGLAFVFNETADKILIKYLLPKGIAMRELGIYSACYKLTIFLTLFVQAYRFAAEPFFFSRYKRPNAKKIYSLMMSVFVLVSLGVFLFVTLYIDYIKLILRSELYHEGIKIVPIVLCANIFLGIYYNLSVWYKVINKTYYAAIISITGSLITLSLNLLFIPRFGYIGAAWTTFLCYFFMAIISFFLSKKHYRIPYNTIQLSYYFFFAGCLFLISSIFNETNFIINTFLFFIYVIFTLIECKRINYKKTENEDTID